MKRTLTLKSETLAELSGTDLAQVVGGEAPSGLTCPLDDCLREDISLFWCPWTIQTV